MYQNHWTNNKPIMIWACQTGGGSNSFAQQLSELLGDRAVVAGTTSTVWQGSDGYVGL
jgi:hypothetical protein